MADEIKISEVKLEDFFTKVLATIGKTTDDQVAELLKQSHQTVSVAESLTGGLISSRLTELAGSSEYFIGGLVSYHNRIKVTELGVLAQVIAKDGPVSQPVAVAMAENIRKKFRTDIGLSATGCAGPSPLPPAPVGQVFIAVASNKGCEWKEMFFQGTRNEVREKAAQSALGLLWLHLGGEI